MTQTQRHLPSFTETSKQCRVLKPSKQIAMVFCSCGNVAVIRTSWTMLNPGRRFYACPVKGSKCKFVGWFDPLMCQRATEIIPGLLRSKNKLEEQLKECQAKNWRLKFRKHHVNNGRLTIPAAYVRMLGLEVYENEQCTLRMGDWEHVMTLQLHGDVRRPNMDAYHMTIRGDFGWFKDIHGLPYKKWLRFEAFPLPDMLLFQVSRLN